ncbi:MAG TPA: hypothetical protein VLF20_00785 [Patescibacteria group bacterium]|nr:hypothetical protein [Patescibacteria group bacterium]
MVFLEEEVSMKRIITLFFILLFSLLTLIPLFTQGFFVTDDGEWMIIRFSAFYQAFADGQFPVRFLHRLNFDHGYPVATFLYPGFMYAGIPFHLLKIGVVDTIKIILGLSLIGTTIFTYLWLVAVFKKNIAAVVGAFVSLYLPYHLYDVYTRGSVGEVFAFLFVPFILWMIERKNFFFVSIGIALLLLAHNSLALLFLPVLFFYALIRKPFSFKNIVLNFVFGLLLAAFFIIPAIFELHYTRFAQTVISDPTKYFASDALIGFSTLLIFVATGSLFIFQKQFPKDYVGVTRLFLVVTFLAVFFSFSWSKFFWQIIPSSFIQFPFRLLSLLVITIPFLSALLVIHIEKRFLRNVVIGIIVLMALLSSWQYMQPKEYINKGEGYYVTNEATTTVQNEYLPVWVDEKPVQRAESKVKGASDITYNNKEIRFSVDQEKGFVLINTIYWPGWRVWVNDKEVAIDYDNPKGLMQVSVPNGTSQIRAEFSETPLRLVADGISLVSFAGLLLFSLRKKKVT